MDENPPTKSSPLLIIVAAWAIVGIPWIWGITQTLKNAAKLFG